MLTNMPQEKCTGLIDSSSHWRHILDKNRALFIRSALFLCTYLHERSVCSLELLEEAHVVLREHAEVFHLILEVGDALNTHTESVA